MIRVWRYRGGRDGYETLQQFMNFLGRRDGGGEEGQCGVSDGRGMRKKRPRVFAGVVTFCVPTVLETGKLYTATDYQVSSIFP